MAVEDVQVEESIMYKYSSLFQTTDSLLTNRKAMLNQHCELDINVFKLQCLSKIFLVSTPENREK